MKGTETVREATIRSVFVTRRARRRTLAGLLVLAIACVVLARFLLDHLPWIADPIALRQTVEGFGPFGPVVFVAVQALQVVVAPVPGNVVGIASGYLFGTLAGTAYSLLGIAIGTYVVVRLSRRFGRRYVERAVDPGLIAQFDDLAGERGLAALFAVFLLPVFPDDVICFVAGLTDLEVREIVAVSVLGRLPSLLLLNAVGARLATGELETAALAVLALAAFSLLGYVKRDSVLRRVGVQPAATPTGRQ